MNILIHLLAAFFLFRTIQILFETPRLSGTWKRSRIEFISLLAAVEMREVASIAQILQQHHTRTRIRRDQLPDDDDARTTAVPAAKAYPPQLLTLAAIK